MPTWFSKAFGGGKAKPTPIKTAAAETIRNPNPILETLHEDEPDEGGPVMRGERTIVQPEIIVDEAELSGFSEEIRIKARVNKDRKSCVFMVDRPVLDGYSAWFPKPEDAGDSPLAQTLFAIKGTGQVLLHGMTVTITANGDMDQPWTEQAPLIGAAIRAHLKAGKPAVSPDFLEGLPASEAISEKLGKIIETVINPEIAGHSGAISLERVEGNTVYIKMMGGCQGCAASDITLRQGIHTTFREAVPQIGAILDETDHNAGRNPFFKTLPVGM